MPVVKQRLLVIGITFVVLASVGVYFWWGAQIESVEFKSPENVAVDVEAKVITCTGIITGQTFFALNEEEVRARILDCDQRIISATVTTVFPRKVTITYRVLQPHLKIPLAENENCLVVESFTVMKKLPQELCLQYLVTEGAGAIKTENPFMLSYIVDFIKKLNEKDFSVMKVTVQTDGYSSYYDLEMQNGKRILLPDGANIDSKVLVIYESIKGLEQSKEGYSVLDVRIDTVIFR